MPGKRLAFLDCLRAVAVLLVFVTHATELLGTVADGGEWLADLSHGGNFGRMGVVVFFAISGFLIPSSLKGNVAGGSARFMVHRLFRLYPAFWFSLLPSAIAQHWLWGQAFSAHDLWLNATMLPRLFDAPMVNGAYWTLEVELFFYAACLFLFAGRLLSNSFVTSALALGLGFLFYTSQRRLWGGLLNPGLAPDTDYFWLHVSVMFWGATCRRIWDGERLEWPARAMFALYTAYLLAFRPLSLLVHLVWLHDATAADLRWVCGYCVALAVFFAGVFLWPPRSRVFAWIGRISYSFYLLSAPAVYVTLWLVPRVPALRALPMLADVAVSFLIALTLSAFSHHAIEAPCIALGRAVSGRLAWLAGRASDAWGALRRAGPGGILGARPPLRPLEERE